MGSQPDDVNAVPDVEDATGATLPAPPEVLDNRPEPIPSTRASRAWIRVLPALIVLTILLVFIFQNGKDVKVSFLGWSGTLPLSLALLASAALGMLVLLALGSVRMLQLRRQVRQKRKSARDRT
jgi:uncharacterized integral membrane protein